MLKLCLLLLKHAAVRGVVLFCGGSLEKIAAQIPEQSTSTTTTTHNF